MSWAYLTTEKASEFVRKLKFSKEKYFISKYKHWLQVLTKNLLIEILLEETHAWT